MQPIKTLSPVRPQRRWKLNFDIQIHDDIDRTFYKRNAHY